MTITRMAVEQRGSNKGQLQTLHTTLDVLEFLSVRNGPVRLTEISKHLGLAKSKVFRILTTLAERGYVRKDPRHHTYSLGIGVWRLSRSVNDINQFAEHVKPSLELLCSKAQETVFLSILHKRAVLYLYTKMAPSPAMYLEIGSTVPIHATASGKILLANQSSEYVDEFLGEPLEKLTDFTLIDRDSLLRELDIIRKRGYSIEKDEWGYGFSAIATTIPTFFHESVAAIGTLFPTTQADDQRLQDLLKMLMDTRIMLLQRLKSNDFSREPVI